MVFRSLAEGRDPFADQALPRGLRERLREAVRPSRLRERARQRSTDGTAKLLLEWERDGAADAVEAVLIPEVSRTTLCVSSQVGCRRGCVFCRTGTMGLERNLGTEQILGQVHHGLRVAAELGLPRLRNLVFMGMGEPLDNWRSVRAALDVLLDGRGYGFGPRHVTVSTVGPSPASIARLAGCKARLAWSLHAADDAVRRRLIPTQKAPVEALRDAFRDLYRDRNEPLFVEMTLIADQNDRPEDADAALALFEGFPAEVRFNLLPMNPWGPSLRPSPPERVEAFAARLRSRGHFTRIRKARGAEDLAACGQLAVLKPPPTSPEPAYR